MRHGKGNTGTNKVKIPEIAMGPEADNQVKKIIRSKDRSCREFDLDISPEIIQQTKFHPNERMMSPGGSSCTFRGIGTASRVDQSVVAWYTLDDDPLLVHNGYELDLEKAGFKHLT